MVATTVSKAATRTPSGTKANKPSHKAPKTSRALKVPKTSRGSPAAKGGTDMTYLEYFCQAPMRQIEMIRRGIPALTVKRIAGDLRIEQDTLLRALNLSVATLNRKVAQAKNLPADESERIAGIARLVGQVEAMVKESGDPEGFNAAEWLSRWLREPLPALGGQMPIKLLDTMAGQALVSQALSRIQSGAYA